MIHLAHPISQPPTILRPFALQAPAEAKWISPWTCQISGALLPRELLLAPEGDGGGGGGAPSGGTGDRTFTQADVDRIVQERLGKQAEKIKTLEAGTARLAEIEKKLAESDEREQKAREEAELKGKTELEKLQIQVQKANEAMKAKDAEWQKKYGDIEQAKTQAEHRFLDHVRRSAVSDALSSAGALKGAAKDAALSFLSEAQIELSEDHQIKTITVGGKSFDKPAEAAKHFLSEKPWYAEPSPGGSGAPRGVNGSAGGQPPSSIAGYFAGAQAEITRQ